MALTALNAAPSTAALAGTLITGKTVAAVAVLHASEVIICNTANAHTVSLVIIEQITHETGATVAAAQAGEPIGATGGDAGAKVAEFTTTLAAAVTTVAIGLARSSKGSAHAAQTQQATKSSGGKCFEGLTT